jgi:Ca2+-binding RTX toxin-like protein
MAPPIVRRYDALNTLVDKDGNPYSPLKNWEVGSAVEIESGVFLTAAHLFSGPRTPPGTNGLYRQIPDTARIDGTLSEGANPPATRTLTGGLEVNLGSIKNFRNYQPELDPTKPVPVAADLAAVSTTSSNTAPQNLTGVAVFLQPTLAQVQQYASQVFEQGFPDLKVTPRAIGPVNSGTVTNVNANGNIPAPGVMLLSFGTKGGESGGPVWFNYGPTSESFVLGTVLGSEKDDKPPTVASTVQYSDFRSIFDVATIPGSFADNEAKGRNLIIGSSIGDDFAGSYRRDWLIGEGGNDTIKGSLGSDEINGGAGTDTVTYRGLKAPDGQTAIGIRKLGIKNETIDGKNQGVTTIEKTVPGSQGSPASPAGTDKLYGVESYLNQTGPLQKLGGVDLLTVDRQFAALGEVGRLRVDLGDAATVTNVSNGTGDATQSGFVDFKFSSARDPGDTTGGPTINIDRAADANLRVANGIWVDGHQLVGGATFDLNKFDRISNGNVKPIWLSPPRTYPAVASDDQVQRWVDEQIEIANKYFNGISGNVPGIGTVSMGPLLGFVFAPILYGQLARFKESWADAYQQDIIGTQGEHYRKVKTGVDDAGKDLFDLTITMRSSGAGNPPYEIVLHNWRNGDFGIRIVETGWRAGLETNTNKNGVLDTWQGVSLDLIRQQLASVGIVGSDAPAAAASAAMMAEASEAEQAEAVVRHGNEAANTLTGDDGNDLLRGGTGDDLLRGEDGQDTYVFAAGDGHDIIEDLAPGGNIIRFLDGLDVASITKQLVAGDNGNQDLLITYGSGDTILIKDWSTLSTEEQDLWTFESVHGTFTPANSADEPDLSVEPDVVGGVALTFVTGTTGDDVITGIDIDEQIDALAGNDVIDAGGGNDDVRAGDGNDTVDGGVGNDVVRGEAGNDVLNGGAGNDSIGGGDGNDVIRGGTGNDLMQTSAGSDTFVFERGDGHDIISTVNNGALADDTLQFGTGINAGDIVISRSASDSVFDPNPVAQREFTFTLRGTQDSVKLQDDVRFFGGTLAAVDLDSTTVAQIVFDNGVVWTKQDIEAQYFAQASTAGADTIVGFDGNETFAGQGGNDRLYGYAGSDTYVWNRLDGNDIIIDTPFQANSDIDRLVLGAGVTAADLTFSRPVDGYGNPSGDLTITIGGANGGTLTVQGYFEDTYNGIEKIVFADGTVWNRTDIDQHYFAPRLTGGNDLVTGTAGDDSIDGGAGNDTISGTGGNDTLAGGTGNDRLIGSTGIDTYRFDANFGQDAVFDNGPAFGDPVPPFPDGGLGNDRIEFTAYNLSDFTFARAGTGAADLVLSRIGSTDQVTIEHFTQFVGAVEHIKFADGTQLYWPDVGTLVDRTAAATNIINGTASAELLTGSAAADRVSAGAGADTINAGDGNDVINAGEGDDQVNGEAGDDIVLAGAGNDAVSGGNGNDIVYADAGNDTVSGDAGADTIDGGGGNDQLDGGADNDRLIGSVGNDTLGGGTGADTLIGGTGSDTYLFNRGDGEDTIQAGTDRAAGEVETLVLGGIAANELQYGFIGRDLVLTVTNSTADRMVIRDFLGTGTLSSIVAGATTLTTAQILEAATGATSGDDMRNPIAIAIESNATLVYGGRGNDTLTGDGTNNTFVFVKGDGQDRLNSPIFFLDFSNDELVIKGYAVSETLLSRAGAGGGDLGITFTSGTDRIDVTQQLGDPMWNGIDAIRFEDGTVWSTADIKARVLAQAATAGNDSITGFDDTADLITGGAGNDALAGGSGNDRYQFNAGHGQDTITDTGGNQDRLEFGAGIRPANVSVARSSLDASDAIITLSGSDVVTLKGVFADAMTGVDVINFADGTVWTKADLANAVLAAKTTAAADTISGTFLGERLTGGLGNDTLSGGAGDDSYVFNRLDGQDTIIELAAGGNDRLLLGSGITTAQVSVRKGSVDPADIVLDAGSGDTITLKGQLNGTAGVEQIVFADGTTWGRVDIDQKLMAAAQTSGADVIAGSARADIITGGAGNDSIDGRDGADVYVFSRGDGQDTISDTGSSIGQDRIEFGTNIGASDIDFSHGTSFNDLVVAIRNTSDRITVKDYFAAGGGKIGEIMLKDGTALFAADIAALADNHAPTVAAPITTQTVAQNAAFNFAVPGNTFADADIGDAISLSATKANGSALPSWLHFDGTSFTGTPGNADVGTPIQVRLTATDADGDTVTTDFTINVANVNDAPVLTQPIANQHAIVGSLLSFQLSAGQFVDPDNGLPGVPAQTITLTATLAGGSPLPSWLTFNPASGTFSGTPGNSNQGVLDIVVTASDESASTSTHFGIFVGNTGNTAPTAGTAIGTQTATEDAAFSFQIPPNAFADATSGDVLRYTATLSNGAALPSWLVLDPVTGTFRGTPANGDVGQVAVKVVATDIFGASASSTFTLQVANVNDAPTATGPLESFVTNEDALFTYTIPAGLFLDVDPGDHLDLTAALADGTPLPAWLHFDAATRTFSGTPDDPDVGMLHIVVGAADQSAAHVEKDMYILVNPMNDAPVVAHELSTVSLDRYQSFSYSVPAGTFVDDSGGVNLTAHLADGTALPSWLIFDPLTRTFSGSPNSASVGDDEGVRLYRVAVVATDNQGASTTTILNVAVRGPNPGAVILGTEGNDALLGTAGPDSIIGLGGNDLLQGRAGTDTYVLDRGFGHDTVTTHYVDENGNDVQAVNDVVAFGAGIAPSEITVQHFNATSFADLYFDSYDPTVIVNFNRDSVLLTLASSGDTVLLQDWLLNDHFGNHQHTVEQIRFADGTVWTAADIVARLATGGAGNDLLAGDQSANLLTGGAGNDRLMGLEGNDTLIGGAGDDDLYGWEGDDTYVFNLGDGHDRIIDADILGGNGIDTLRFGTGIRAEQLVFTRDPRDPYSFDPAAGNLLISIAGTNDSIQIYRQYVVYSDVSGGIDRFEFADGTVLTRAQIDDLINPAHLLQGTDGDDTLSGGASGERIIGGKGDDRLRGDAGDDTYVWRLGDGNDEIWEYNISSFDVLEFGVGVRAEDITFSHMDVNNFSGGNTGAFLFLTIGPTNETITIEYQFKYGSFGQFIPVIDEFHFADGTVWTASDIVARSLQSTPGDDLIYGFPDRGETLDGGAGNDSLAGLSGADTYVFGRGYGADSVSDGIYYIFGSPEDRIAFDNSVRSSDILLSRAPVRLADGRYFINTVFSIAGTTDSLTVDKIEEFAGVSFGGDAVNWNISTLKSQYYALAITGGNDTVFGFSGDKVINTGAGDDRLGGADLLIGGVGNDTYVFMGGFVTISDNGSATDVDTLELDPGIAPGSVSVFRAGNENDLVLNVGYAQTVVLRNWLLGPQYNIEQIHFSDGTVWDAASMMLRAQSAAADAMIVVGTSGADSLTGAGFNATFDSLAGNDTIDGGTGSNIYLYRAGYGNDTIIEGGNQLPGVEYDIIKLPDLTAAQVTAFRSGIDFIVYLNGTGERITVTEQLNQNYYRIEEVAFADHTVWDRSIINATAGIGGTDGNDTLSGDFFNDVLGGFGGNDSISGGSGTDTVVFGGSWRDYTIAYNAGTQTYTLSDRRAGTPDGIDTVKGVERFQFADRTITVTTAADLLNDAPTDIAVAGGAIDENSAVGAVAGILSLVDPDAGDAGTFTLVSGATDKFEVIGNEIRVKAGAVLDFETTPSYQLGIQATDAGGLSVTTTITLTVNNVDESGITGTAGNDTLTGTAAANRINAFGGDDVLTGAAGADTLDGGSGFDVASYAAAATGLTVSLAAPASNTGDAQGDVFAGIEGLAGSAFNDVLTGDAGANTISGGAGNDTLDGGSGNDTLVGGTGDDVYVVDVAGDMVTENAAEGTDEIRTAAASWTVAANVEKLTYTGSVAFAGTGNALDNVLTGGAGNDTLDGGTGNDTLNGGAGDDTYVVDSTGDVVSEGVGAGRDEIRTTLASYTLGSNVENLTYVGAMAFAGTGNAADNIIIGGSGADTLDGAAGSDTLVGGAGGDIYIVNAGDVVIENPNTNGVDEVRTALASIVLADNVENLTYTGSGAFSAIGNASNNLITGGAGNDTLDGTASTTGSGDDTLVGGAGNDLYILDVLTPAVVIEQSGGGVDEVRLRGDSTQYALTYTLAAEVENMTYLGTSNFTGTGNALANVITGGSGNDTLSGGAGADTLIGGAGDDTYTVDAAGDVVTENAGGGIDLVRATASSYTLGANIENLTYTGNGSFSGTGNALANTITGRNGNDTLDGGLGIDTLIGGTGNDTYVIDTLDDVMVENAGAGTDTVRTTLASFTLGTNFENLTYNGTGNFTGFGSAVNNVLTGAAGNDTLDGGAGNDTLVGGAGNDVFIVDSASDVITEGTGAGIDEVRTSIASYTLAANVENLTFMGTGDFTGTGSAVANVITAGAGNDTLNGAAGSDTLIGGLGNDVYLVDTAGDVVTETAGQGFDEVRASASYALGANIERLIYTGTGAFAGTGNALDNEVVGASGNDTLDGGAGADTLTGGTGNDVYVVDSTSDVLVEAAGAGTDEVRTTLTSFALANDFENLTFVGTGSFLGVGNSVANVITGASGNDILDGGAGNDTLVGGTGDDLYFVDAADVVTEAAGAGTDEVRTAAASYTLGANIEILTFVGDGNFTGTGGSTANTIVSRDGNDTLNGGAGNDTLIGGLGNDVYLVDSASDVVIENAGAGTDEVRATAASYTLGAEIEKLTFTGTGAFAGTGNALDNTITGGTGADTLDGGAGNDTLIGGTGNDVYIVGAASDVVTEGASAGTDEVRTALASYTLGANLETLTFTGTGAFAGTGNTAANTITGGVGNDTLDGGTGIDTLVGGAGNDVYIVDVSTDVITEGTSAGTDEVRTALASYTLGTNVENLAYTGASAFTGTGNTLDNVITGGNGADSLSGGSGNDTMIGGAGNDTMVGAVGNDVYYVDQTGDVVTEAASAGTDEVRTTLASYTLGTNLENLAYVGTGNFTGTGNTVANIITGGIGNDTLSGGTGNDTMIGGAGNDVYIVDVAADVMTENPNEGIDEVRTALTTYTVGNNVENLTFTGTGAFTGTGNTLNNLITAASGADTLNGGAGDDTLSGGTGADRMVGGTGNDVYIVDSASDVVVESAGEGVDEVRTSLSSFTLGTDVDNLTFTGTAAATGTGNTLDNFMTGGSGADTLGGGGGNDFLRGLAGNDSLSGGVGNDTFVFNVGFGKDTITDFTAGAGVADVIEFHDSMFANFAAVQAASTQVGADVQITIDAATSILLKSITLANLVQDDFRFL